LYAIEDSKLRDRLQRITRVLIIAYGNPMRSDDGLAGRAADGLEGKYPPSEVEMLRVHQLAPELARVLAGRKP
jgi:Ni,Fe-hydrogenase maturation factor